MCNTLNPLDPKSAKAQWRSKTSVLFTIGVVPTVPAAAVKLTQVISNAMNVTTDPSVNAAPFQVILDSNPWPEHTYLKVSVTCGTGVQVTTETLTFDIDTSKPAISGAVPVALRAADENDAGAP
jgi:hypothetical protein